MMISIDYLTKHKFGKFWKLGNKRRFYINLRPELFYAYIEYEKNYIEVKNVLKSKDKAIELKNILLTSKIYIDLDTNAFVFERINKYWQNLFLEKMEEINNEIKRKVDEASKAE